MKTLFLIAVSSFTFLAASAQINVNSIGKVGINNSSPSYQLDISGNFRISYSGYSAIYSDGEFYSNTGYSALGSYSYWWDELYAGQPYFSYNPIITSDINAKTDIKDIADVSAKMQLLRPVSYKLIPRLKGNEEADAVIIEQAKPEQLGFIAQEVIKIFPEMVSETKDGVMGIKYSEFIPVLVKAFQEQQQVIDSLKIRIETLESTKQ